MSTARSQQPRCSFGGIEICYTRIVVHSPGRHHVHEYPHSPGGAPEKLGRGLAHVTVTALFHDRFKRWDRLYPETLQKLAKLAQRQDTQTFVHPSLGSFDAFIINWTQTLEARILSGESVDIEFLEDSQSAFTADNIASPVASDIETKNTIVQASAAVAAADRELALAPKDQNLFDAIHTTVNSILAFKDTTDLYGNAIAAKIDGLTSLCSQVDNAISMQDPRAWPVVTSVRDLMFAAIQLKMDLQTKGRKLSSWVVPSTMAAADVARALFGDSSRQADVLSLNGDNIDDATRIQAGTKIRYYPDPITP